MREMEESSPSPSSTITSFAPDAILRLDSRLSATSTTNGDEPAENYPSGKGGKSNDKNERDGRELTFALFDDYIVCCRPYTLLGFQNFFGPLDQVGRELIQILLIIQAQKRNHAGGEGAADMRI